jgi:hypothetical protein
VQVAVKNVSVNAPPKATVLGKSVKDPFTSEVGELIPALFIVCPPDKSQEI